MNMRKIIAVLSAVLLLCAAIPMGVYAAPGDVAVDWNFDDGVAHFERGTVENGYMVFDATTADWQCAYQYIGTINSDTTYKVTFKAMANKDAELTFKIQNDWAATNVAETVGVTTEWQEYELIVNSGTVNPPIVLFSSGVTAANAAIYYIDDLKIVEIVDPALIGKVVNADFETGDNTGWETLQSTSISADAAHDGSYGAHLIGGGTWGGMLNQAIVATPGKSYEISFWVKVNANGINFKIQDGDWTGSNLASAWYDTANNSEWTQRTFIVTPTTSSIYLNFCGAGNDTAEDAYVDSFTCTELKDPSFDGYITNGDFETGKTDSWDPVWWAGNISIVEGGHNGDYAMQVNHGMYQLVRQLVTVEPNTDYVVQCYAKNVSSMTLLAKSYPADANIAQAGMSGGDDWTQNSLVFNSGDCTQVYIGVMGNVDGASAIVDDFFMFEKVEESNDGYIINGNFETGALTPWNNLWGSCPKAEIVRGGMDSNFALEIVSGQWKHVRQTGIAVEANTDYKITAWAKNASGMSLLVKDGGDSTDIVNAGVSAGDEWTQFTIEFNTGDYTTIIFSLMGNNAESAFGTFDNIVMEKVVAECEHEYEFECSTTCKLCGEETRPEAEHSYFYPCDPVCQICYEVTNPDATHNIVAVEAVDATCTENGNIAYWYCADCGTAWADEALTQQTNQRNVIIPATGHEYFYACDKYCMNCGEETNPDADHSIVHVEAKAAVSCVEYGNEEYWHCESCGAAWLDANLIRQTNMMSVRTAGECISDAEHPCQDGVCINCGLPCGAEADHEYDDDYDADCNVCGEVREVETSEIVYGDADGDGEITLLDATVLTQYLSGYEVTLTEDAADADGDGEITLLDATVLTQYLSGYDVTLGPV